MSSIEFIVEKIIGDRRFSADGSNTLFNHIDETLKSAEQDGIDLILIDFSSINLVSTSFIGRLQSRISQFKINHPDIKLRFTNLRPEIKRQFLKKDEQ